MLARQSVARAPSAAVALPGAHKDARLIARVAGHDLKAFEELYKAYHPRLTRFLSTLIARPHLVEEVLNDTMFVVWNRSDSYNGASKVSTWIFAIAYRKAMNALRRYKDPLEDKQAEKRQSPDADPEMRLGAQDVQRLLLTAMGELSEDHRTVVDLTYFHDLGYKDIALIMACPVDTVKTRMFHARRHLKRMLSGSLTDWL